MKNESYANNEEIEQTLISNANDLKECLDIKTLSGIDTLYYYCESSKRYESFYLDLLYSIELQTEQFKSQGITPKPRDIRVSINDIEFMFLGKSESYVFMMDVMEFVRIGFKDAKKEHNVHDIRVQLQANGIYTLGIKPLLEYVNSIILKGLITTYLPITRCDLNIFIQTNLDFLTKEHFISRAIRSESFAREINKSSKLQTLYIGKEPFKMRLYDKSLELKSSSKRELMQEYLGAYDIDINKPLWNLEFQMQREFLKSFNILDLEDVVKSAEKLFYKAMDLVKMIDLDSISEADKKNGHRYRASIHPFWEYLKNSYTLKTFYQIEAPLDRVKKRAYKYTTDKAIDEHIELTRKMVRNGLYKPDESFYDEVVQRYKNRYETKPQQKEPDYIDGKEISMQDGSIKDIRIFKDGKTIEPIKTISPKHLSDYELYKYRDELLKDFLSPKPQIPDCIHKLRFAEEEMVSRGLLKKPEEMF